ncbi:pentapeptide repeat-containing protein [Streptomyces roseicoloratus]|uniref:Pentapeptide repeat-containing protein n=1 Tax=Streptomyces roseicoloratus TaxID=2508722 RepID=A0ABY9S2L3_9ACTN|nr:pentapeptide repeat-containing protein [Streptomyces roseicoloratus]WMX48482.1 pentapeptide repeat-containing protein [Streptomyces roseicoloratus]
MSQTRPAAPHPDELRGDCANCFGLCCVALPFARSHDFAVNKSAGDPCRNLQDDFRCGIHTRLRDSGFPGCTVYDCFGAGQHVSQVVYGGVSWREAPDTARQMYEVFPVVRGLYELLRHLTEARSLAATRPLHRDLDRALSRVTALTGGDAAELERLDVAPVRAEVNPLLLKSSALVRAEAGGKPKDRRGADLIGKRLRGAKLRGADLRGALLIAADLTGADLSLADLIGADLRDADLSGADLTGALFLTQPQLNSARGDAATRLPEGFERPAHWTR